MRALERIKAEKERRAVEASFETFAPANLKLIPEKGGLETFRINRVQLYVHQKIEQQLESFKRVRALLLKARKQGASTYVAGRFYKKTSRTEGISTVIMAHEQEASDTLFNIVNIFHQHDPYAPRAGTANAKELYFPDLTAGYRVLTAGAKATGRSKTPHLLHGSEFGYWPNVGGHMGGIVQAVPEADGTEIILESTADGMGGAFHIMWQQAEAGESDFIPIFTPWFMTPNYRRDVPRAFSLSEEEAKYKRLYQLDDQQIAFRRAKIHSIPDGFNIFRREFPATSNEAFQASGENSFIPPELVIEARKTEHAGIGPLIIGADPARYGKDRFSLAWRRGRKVMKIESKVKIGNVEGASWIKGIIDREKPARVFIDLGGQGAGVFDILIAWGEPYSKIVKGVNFSGAPLEPYIYLDDGTKRPGPYNKRAEIWMNSKAWLEQEGGADIPDLDSLQTDACGPRFKYHPTTQHTILESKEDIIGRGLRSPDEWDAVALTFSEPVADLATKDIKVRSRAADPNVGV